MEEKNIRFDFAARYFTAGKRDQHTRQIWIVIHGYGQLAQFFLKKFEPLTEKGVFVIAPEGLSRFYLSELTNAGRADNRVGATWMTRENRLMDIDNYINYLDTVYMNELGHSGRSAEPHSPLEQEIPITLLGFSQGCATVCRWALDGHPKFSRLVLWAGLFPPDMDFKKGHDVFADKETYMVIGEQDPFLSSERMAEFDALAAKLDVIPKKLTFPGKHELNLELLQEFAR